MFIDTSRSWIWQVPCSSSTWCQRRFLIMVFLEFEVRCLLGDTWQSTPKSSRYKFLLKCGVCVCPLLFAHVWLACFRFCILYSFLIFKVEFDFVLAPFRFHFFASQGSFFFQVSRLQESNPKAANTMPT